MDMLVILDIQLGIRDKVVQQIRRKTPREKLFINISEIDKGSEVERKNAIQNLISLEYFTLVKENLLQPTAKYYYYNQDKIKKERKEENYANPLADNEIPELIIKINHAWESIRDLKGSINYLSILGFNITKYKVDHSNFQFKYLDTTYLSEVLAELEEEILNLNVEYTELDNEIDPDDYK